MVSGIFNRHPQRTYGTTECTSHTEQSFPLIVFHSIGGSPFISKSKIPYQVSLCHLQVRQSFVHRISGPGMKMWEKGEENGVSYAGRSSPFILMISKSGTATGPVLLPLPRPLLRPGSGSRTLRQTAHFLSGNGDLRSSAVRSGGCNGPYWPRC